MVGNETAKTSKVHDDSKNWKDGGPEGLQDGDSGRELPEGLKRERKAPGDEKAPQRKDR